MSTPDKYNSINWHEYVYYDETSPTFLRWKVDRRVGPSRSAVKRAAGDVAGGVDKVGYAIIVLNRKSYRAHRVIWCLFQGTIDPELQIDHVDGDKSNNNIENLRLVTRTTNQRNRNSQYNSSTGVNGVSLSTDGKGYRYYVSSWRSIHGKCKQKCFSILKLGEAEAFRLACEHRKRIIEELNSQGAGYTNRHGG